MSLFMPNNKCPESPKKEKRISVREMTLFAMLGTIMYCSKIIMQVLPNIHLLGLLTITYTIVFRVKALIPIYIYIMEDGLFSGFSLWWIPYLYIWTILWGIVMLLPQEISPGKARIIYPAVCCIHGLLFGTFYAPVQALIFGMTFHQTVVWIAAGLPWDFLHGISNLFVGLLILPLSKVLYKLKVNKTSL